MGKKFYKSHKSREAAENHMEKIKARGGRSYLKIIGKDFDVSYWFPENKPGPKKGVKRGPKPDWELVNRIKVYEIDGNYSLMDKYITINRKKYVSEKINFKTLGETHNWIIESGYMNNHDLIIVFWKGRKTYMPYSRPKPPSRRK